MPKRRGWNRRDLPPLPPPPPHFLPSGVASHCPAVLDAGLGGDVGPGQQRAQQGLGVSVQPLGDGAGAEAGQGGANVLDIVSGAGAVKENHSGRGKLNLFMGPTRPQFPPNILKG